VIVVISGPGGVGKGTLVDHLLGRDPHLWLSRSWTTRPRRAGESEMAYTFVSREQFLERLEAGGFLEHNDFAGNDHLYGTPQGQVVPPDKDLVLEIDVNGAAQVKEADPSAVLILVVPPSREEQEARLRARGDDDDHIRQRVAIAEVEVEQGRRIADHVVINDDLDRAVEEVAGILQKYR
jgi:guanylate kinase